ncbi:MAG: molecular chaperone DnaJ [Bacteroidetes bacterium]|jgi:curved DNA-binding protein CbpA|nr:molecular chaperone DnaJ [Bacteroidota bacterium]
MPEQRSKMRKIVEYRKLMGVDKAVTLSELKSLYRNFMKEFHPDKIQDNEELKLEVEEKSKKIIEAYHFLVSIAPETIEATLADYNNTTANSQIADITYTGKRLRIDFQDGSGYEYFGVPENTYVKLVNADSQGRFARRHIYTSFLYRNVSKTAMVV